MKEEPGLSPDIADMKLWSYCFSSGNLVLWQVVIFVFPLCGEPRSLHISGNWATLLSPEALQTCLLINSSKASTIPKAQGAKDLLKYMRVLSVIVQHLSHCPK